jgi:putative membrane protein
MNELLLKGIMAFGHHLAAFSLFAALVYEWILIRKPFDLATAQSLLKTDQIYGLSAVAILLLGFARVFHFEKGADYYFHSLPFILKISLFALAGLISAYPTMIFLSWRKALKQQQLPQLSDSRLHLLRRIIQLELLALLAILLCAALMAKGVGYLG